MAHLQCRTQQAHTSFLHGLGRSFWQRVRNVLGSLGTLFVGRGDGRNRTFFQTNVEPDFRFRNKGESHIIRSRSRRVAEKGQVSFDQASCVST